MAFTQKSLATPHGPIDVLVGGEGPPLTVLHRDTGRGRWNAFHTALARSHRVIAPAFPGYDGTERPDWLRSAQDLGALIGHALDALDATPGALLGLGFGGWIAAELAARSPQRVSALVLQAPMGLKPPQGEIVDQILIAAPEYVRIGFTSEEAFKHAFPEPTETYFETWWANREMTTRLAWKPYMYDKALSHLLKGVSTPATIIRSKRDVIVPASCADAYRAALPRAELLEIDAGHQADLEAPDALADLILKQLERAPRARARA